MFKAKVIRGAVSLTEGMPELPSDEVHGEIPLTEEAGTDMEKLQRQAYERGYHEGEKAGYEVGLKKAEALIERLKDLLREVEGYRKGLQEKLQEQVLRLTTSVAGAILKEEIKARKALMVELIKEAARKLEPSGPLQIRVHPLLRDIIERVDGLEGLHESVKVEVDPSLKELSARVGNTEQVAPLDIDALVQGLMEELKERMLRDESGHSGRVTL